MLILHLKLNLYVQYVNEEQHDRAVCSCPFAESNNSAVLQHKVNKKGLKKKKENRKYLYFLHKKINLELI